MFDFIALALTLSGCVIIVVVLSKMSQRTHYGEKYHYRCSSNFSHVFSVYEIRTNFDTDKVIHCPIHNCGGELVLYEVIPEEEVVHDD